MVKALGSSSRVRSNGICGNSKLGSAVGSSPKRLPMVSVGRANSVVTAVHTSSASRKPGHFGFQ